MSNFVDQTLEELQGRELDEFTLDALRRLTGDAPIRILREGEAGTMDVDDGRMTVYVDSNNVIADIVVD